jgi:sugar phosphate isomerase/epimerase
VNQPIAIQSWCYRHFKAIPEFLTQLKAAGVNAAEVCAVHANFLDPSSASKVAEQFKSAGVRIVAIGVETLGHDAAKDRARFEWCKAAGVRNMSFTFGPEAMFDGLKRVEALADEFDITLGIHNHGGYDWLGNVPILKYIFGRTSKRIGLHLDTAWAMDAKQDAVKMAEQFADRLVGVHVKDFVFDRAREPKDVIIGEGNLDLPKFMSLLKRINFAGPLVIEYEGDEQNPVPALSECVKKLKALI